MSKLTHANLKSTHASLKTRTRRLELSTRGSVFWKRFRVIVCTVLTIWLAFFLQSSINGGFCSFHYILVDTYVVDFRFWDIKHWFKQQFFLEDKFKRHTDVKTSQLLLESLSTNFVRTACPSWLSTSLEQVVDNL